MFFWNSADFLMIQQMLAIWSLVPLLFLNPAWTSGSSQFTWTTVEAWFGEFWALIYSRVRWVKLCGSLNILWHCLSLGLEWKLTFSSPVSMVELSKFAGILSAALSQHHLLGFEIAQLEFHHLHRFVPSNVSKAQQLHTPGCLALVEWPHHHGYMGH